jgi:hypothetical protein
MISWLEFKEGDFDRLIEEGFRFVVKLGDTETLADSTAVHLYSFKTEEQANHFVIAQGNPGNSFIMPVDTNLERMIKGFGRLKFYISSPILK